MYNEFKVKNSILFSEVKIIFPDIFNDHRGIIFTDYLESYFTNTFKNKLRFGHSKFAQNFQNVLRGIHGDFKSYKLICSNKLLTNAFSCSSASWVIKAIKSNVVG